MSFLDLYKDALSEGLFLEGYHLVADCAEVKQIEHVDFENLRVAELLKSVLKFCLLAAQICPQRVLKLGSEISWHVGLVVLTIFIRGLVSLLFM